MESWKADEKQIDEVKSAESKVNSAKGRRKKIQPRQMLEKSRNAVFFQWFMCPVSRKVGSLKRRVRSHVVRGEIKNCTPLWREAHFQVKMYKTLHARSIARRCGEKHILKSKCTKRVSFGPLLKVTMSKNCTPLWGEAHFEVKMLNWRSQTTFGSSDVEKMHAAVARSTCVSQNVQDTCVLPHFLKFRCRKISQLVN